MTTELNISPEDFEFETIYFEQSIDLIVSLTNIELSTLFDYIERVEVAIDKEFELMQQEINRAKSEGYSEYLIDEFILRAEDWHEYLYNSVIITVHIGIEKILNEFCETIRLRNNLDISYKDLQGGGFRRAISYLEKIGHIRIPDGNDDWNKLRVLGNIRNIIVHNDGIVPEKDNSTPREIMNFKNIEIDDSRKIKLSLEFGQEMIAAAGRFIHYLGEEIKKM